MGILSLIGLVFGGLKTMWNRRQERKQNEHEVAMKLEESKIRFAEKQIEFGHRLSIAQLKSTAPWFKVFTFMAWFLPYIVIIVWPSAGIAIFENLGHAPLWYVQTMQILLFAVWGIAVGKDAIAQVFSGITSYWTSKNTGQTVVMNRKVDRQKFFKEYGQQYKRVSSGRRKVINKILDELGV